MPSLSPTRRSTIRRAATAATATAAACALALVPLTAASAAVVPEPITYSADDAALTLSPLGSFETGVFDESAAEIVAAYQDRLFVVNALAGSVSVLDATYFGIALIRSRYGLPVTGSQFARKRS